LVSHLPVDGIAVLNRDDAEMGRWRGACQTAILQPPLLETLPPLQVPGEHNRINAACAATMAKSLGINDKTVAEALANFTGLRHRLQFVAEIDGRRFYNDSKSTTLIATSAALNTMERPTWLLLGGADKKIDVGELVDVVRMRAKGVALFGAVAGKLHELFCRGEKTAAEAAGNAFFCFHSETLAEALRWCWQNSLPEEAILLSPGFVSIDQYRDFAERGEEFERLVQSLKQD
jgi:UDP-N-acetylmuramoylalanine--D-glutamate ligase